MLPKVSIFIPVHQESDVLVPLLRSLLDDPYENKEIFVIVDDPTRNSIETSTMFPEIHFIWNREREGKVNALNDLVPVSKGEILFFLDSDSLLIEKQKSLLTLISQKTEEADIIEIKKNIIRDSWLARIVSYDYLAFTFSSWLFSRRLNKCLGLNGAAFAIKREVFTDIGGFRKVIAEDLDMGIRSYISEAKYLFLGDIEVHTKAPSSWKNWFKQRKRWGIGSALWLKEYFRDLISIVRKNPEVLLPLLLFIFPCLPFFIFTLIVPDEYYVKAIYFSLLILSSQASLLLPPTVATSISIATVRNLTFMISSLGIYSVFYYVIAKKMSYRFNVLEFVFYYMVYSPLWLVIILASITRISIRQKGYRLDWKI